MNPVEYESSEIIIEIKPKDHWPPHAHIKSKNDSKRQGKMDVDGVEDEKSSLNQKEAAEARDWFKNNRTKFLDDWDKFGGEKPKSK